MVKSTTATTVALACVLFVARGQALAQESTATSTRRPTPVSTPTRTPTGLAATPTPPSGGSDTFLCSAGSNDGRACNVDEDCTGGACVLTQGVCDGSDAEVTYCASDDDCTGGVKCLAAQRICLAGTARGVSCLHDSQCPESTCISSGLFCDAGDFESYSCIDDGGCEGSVEDGQCVSPDVQLCSGGPNDGISCRGGLDCPNGACVLAQTICDEGTQKGADCESSFDCPGAQCVATARVCDGGVNKAFGCLTEATCAGASCVSTGLLCDGGVYESVSCVDDASCSPAGEAAASCVVPSAAFYCSGGDNDGAPCNDDDSCPGGGCVFSQGVCDGGRDDGVFCETDAECRDSVPCVQTQRVCLAGDSEGLACLGDGHCGAGILCGSSGLFCVGGDFESLSCVADENCCNDDGCNDESADGACFGPTALRCSAGAQNEQACTSHFDCPNGACVVAQGVCDGGSLDGELCEGAVQCDGAPCVVTAKICIRNGEINLCVGGTNAEDLCDTPADCPGGACEGQVYAVEGFGCLRDDHCLAGAGACQETGQACDGGDTTSADYDPFELQLSCTDDQVCRDFSGDDQQTCRAPTNVGTACSAGSRDGQTCSLDSECSGGVCVLQDSLCEGGTRDAELCDTSADCPGGACQATQRVCSESGFSCVNTSQCAETETCVSTGRVCSADSTFGGFSCVDDVSCYDADNPNDEQGACVAGADGPPRACSLEAPCELDGVLVGEVFGFSIDPDSSPATFDFYLVPIPDAAVGVSVVLRPFAGDSDLYLGREVVSSILEPASYPFASSNSGESTDVVRVSPQSSPTFTEFTAELDEFAAAVAGLGGNTSYSIEAVFLGASEAGDANCSGAVTKDDLDGLVDVLFDPAARLTAASSPFGRCLGADANSDGAETAPDFVATIRASVAP